MALVKKSQDSVCSDAAFCNCKLNLGSFLVFRLFI